MITNQRNASLLFIFITILLDVIGLGLIIPVLPKIINHFVGNDLPLAARYSGMLMGVYALMQFFFAPVIGALSDQFGRRSVLLFALFGFGLDYILLALAPDITWLIVGRVIAGITGASYTTATAYIADISAPEERGKNFGLVGAAFGVGFVIGPVIGGLLATYDLRLPFWFAAGLTFINWLYGYFILPESLSKENRRPFNWKRANPVGSLLQLNKYPTIIGMLGAVICLYLSQQIHPSTWAFFTMKQFDWSPFEVGLSLAFVGLMIGAVQGGLIRVITPKLGNRKAVIFGMVFYTIGFLLFSFASQGWMMYAIMVPFALGGISGPTLQGMISSQVEPNQQGELQGAMTSLMAVTAFIGPLLHSNLFSYFTSKEAPIYFPGAAFLLGSMLSIVALFILLRTMPKDKEVEK
jgi:MFS transporter, DHA1 family, tetracycline resistance protein